MTFADRLIAEIGRYIRLDENAKQRIRDAVAQTGTLAQKMERAVYAAIKG